MSQRKLEILSFEIDRFATIKFPFMDAVLKQRVLNFQQGRRLSPITVIKTSKLLDVLSCAIYDLKTGEALISDKDKRESWFILDGCKRLKSLMLLYDETKNPAYMTIDAVVETIDNIENKNVIKYMADVNSIVKPWTPKDYVDCGYIMFPDNHVFQMAHLLMDLGVSISTVSRFSTGTPKGLCTNSLIQFFNGDESKLWHVSYTRALELYRLFLELGFSIDFIKHRYLIDFINDECSSQSSIGFQGAVNMIASVDKLTIQIIEALPFENKKASIYGILIQHYKDCKESGNAESYTLDFSLERFIQNLNDIPHLAR